MKSAKLDLELMYNRILTLDDYFFEQKQPYEHYDITDKIVSFYNGRQWNIIQLEDMLAHPVLYFNFWSAKQKTTFVNSLLLCPITMRALIYKGRIKIIDVVNDRLVLTNIDTGDEFFMDMPFTGTHDEHGNEKKIKSQVKRHEVRLLTLRDCFTFMSDPQYIVLHKKVGPIIAPNYYSNRLTYDNLSIHTTYHPKTIVYMIQYYSSKINNYRYTVVVGTDINKDTATGFAVKVGGIWSFLSKHMDDVIAKRAYVYPIMWHMVDTIYAQNGANVNIITTHYEP
jgi:hypothetical protein